MTQGKRSFVFQVAKSLIALVFVCCFYVYPAVFTFQVATSQEFTRPQITDHSLKWFNSVSNRFEKWAGVYLKKQHALSVSPTNVAATEWPMFGSVFYLLTAEEVNKQISGRNDPLAQRTRQALWRGSESAIKVIVDPATAHWVKKKWGSDYLNKENVFYRMLLIMGLSSYETITGKKTYQSTLAQQASSLAEEFLKAPYHLLDDYPGECWPNDVLWAVAAIQRADRLIATDHGVLAEKVMGVLNREVLTRYGLPAYKIDSRTLEVHELSRGCGNSGILIFAPELDRDVSLKWYANYEKHFWQENALMCGFREFPFDSRHSYADVDSGPVVGGYGSVATFFGIGAARKAGRLDQAVPMTQELLALSWPTPFGYLTPSLASWLGTKSWVLGETAMLFSLTRVPADVPVIAHTGKTPGIVWIAFLFYLSFAVYHAHKQFCSWKKWLIDDKARDRVSINNKGY